MAERRILVTGGAGFLGSHLCERLLRDGHHVTCLDDFSTGVRANVAHLEPDRRFRLIEGDVRQERDLAVDEIYNLACPASPPRYQADPVRTIRICVDGTVAVLELARRTGARVLQASTSEVYGDPRAHPQSEDLAPRPDPSSPRACYEEGKRVSEVLCHDYRRRHGSEVRIVRIFNTYGPRMQEDDGRVISNFVTQALAGAPLTIYGDGSQTRSFCYVDDMTEALVALMAAPGAIAGPVNAGNPGEITVAELARIVLARTGSASPVVHRPAQGGDPKRRCPDIARLTGLTGWRPRTGFDDGLDATIRHHRDRRAASAAGAGAGVAP